MVQITGACLIEFEDYLFSNYGYTSKRFYSLPNDMQLGVYLSFFNMTGMEAKDYIDAVKQENTKFNNKTKQND